MWAGVSCPSLPPSGLSVVCRDDGKLAVSWDAVTGASQYTATIISTPPPSPAAVSLTSTKNQSSTSFEMDARVGWTYAVQVKAQVNSAWSGFSDAESDTCAAKRPPAPIGVTASCQAGVLTVTWNTAGTGLAKATLYKPRIFTGSPATESTSWTANAAGHDTTSATIPATGEPALPDSDVFQVKVKAVNAAGDSPWSAAVDVTCGKPGPVTGLKCTAATDDGFTVSWDGAVGAESFEVQSTGIIAVGLLEIFWEAGGQPSGSGYAHAFDSLGSDHQFLAGVRAVNDGGDGPETTVRCHTIDDDWLEVECTASGIVDADWDDPSGALPEPTGYLVRMTGVPNGQVYSAPVSGTEATKLFGVAEPYDQGDRYEVTVTSRNGNGGPVYSQSKVAQCPGLDLDWNSPNFTNVDDVEDCPRWMLGCRESLTHLAVAESWAQGFGIAEAVYAPPVFVGQTCEMENSTTLACTQVWSENLTVRSDGGPTWRDIPLTNWSSPGNVGLNVLTIGGAVITLAGGGAGWAVVAGTGAAGGTQFFGFLVNDEQDRTYLTMYPHEQAAKNAGVPFDGTAAGGCMPPLGFQRADSPHTSETTHQHGTLSEKRKIVVHHCDATD